MLSVVIPTLDEEETLGPLLRAIAAAGDGHETIVVDGGSRDRTCEVARAGGARLVVTSAGRGRQMNAGARAARGDGLFFVHADLGLPPGALGSVERALEDPAVVGGGFVKRYADGGPLLACTGAAQNLIRSRWAKRLVGTQAMFVRRSVFEALGGYREWPLLEDVELSDRLRRLGRVAILEPAVIVSTRRYRERGVLRQTLANLIIMIGFRLGWSPERLARVYYGTRP